MIQISHNEIVILGMNSCTGYGSTHTVESQKQSCQDKVWLHSSSKTFHTGMANLLQFIIYYNYKILCNIHNL